jgi:putative transposase
MRGEWNVSIRRACRVFEVDTSTYHYKSRRPGQAVLEQRIKEICQTRVRYGYRRIHVLLRREGCRHGQNKTRRIYRELGLQLRNKTPKRRVTAKLRDDRKPATRSNETWAMDFVHDQLATGRKLRVLTIVDTFSRYSPALEPRFTFRGCCGGAGKGRPARGIPGDNPCRSRYRVRLTRPGSVGLSARRHARLLATR